MSHGYHRDPRTITQHRNYPSRPFNVDRAGSITCAADNRFAPQRRACPHLSASTRSSQPNWSCSLQEILLDVFGRNLWKSFKCSEIQPCSLDCTSIGRMRSRNTINDVAPRKPEYQQVNPNQLTQCELSLTLHLQSRSKVTELLLG